MKKTNNIKSFEQFNKTLKNSTNERYFGGSDSDGEVNIKIDGDDEGLKKSIVKEIQLLLNSYSGKINLYLDGERIHSREKFKDINFSPVTGDFDTKGSKLSNIQGSPKPVDKFDITGSKLSSIQGSPRPVDKFDITGSKLSSIQGSPWPVGSPRSATNERYFGGSINDGVVNIKIDGDDEELKKSIVKQIQNILNNYSGMVNLYLDGEQINSRSWG